MAGYFGGFFPTGYFGAFFSPSGGTMPAHVLTDLPAQGTLLSLKISTVFTLLGQRVSLDGPDPELSIRIVTGLDSTSVKKRAGIPNFGKLSGKLFYDPNDTIHIAVRAKVTTPPAAPDEWQMVYADGLTTPASDVFKGFVTKFKPTGIEVNGTLEADFEIDLTDEFVITAGTP